MIIVVGHLTIAPEHRETAIEAMRACVAATRAETGNIDYRYSPDLDEENRFNLTEAWEDDAAMEQHMATPHMATFLTTIGPCIGGDVEIVRHDVSASARLF